MRMSTQIGKKNQHTSLIQSKQKLFLSMGFHSKTEKENFHDCKGKQLEIYLWEKYVETSEQLYYMKDI